jgi:hypothetical protein
MHRLNNNPFLPDYFKIEIILLLEASRSDNFGNLSTKETSKFMEKEFLSPFRQTKSRNRKAK